ncbi:MAG: nucleoside deaminase [Desulfovibrio sp.]|nr:nucleoside deaminase [Desulfovibrio sp.]
MDMALAEALRAEAEGEVPVGAVVAAPDGRILAACHNQPVGLHDPTAHAEILAMRTAGAALGNYRLNGCVLVVTLEPCPMCAAALLHARLAGVVYGAADPLAGAVTSCAEYLGWPGQGPWHMGGVQAEACAALLQKFFSLRRGV